jgi:ribosomal protein L29
MAKKAELKNKVETDLQKALLEKRQALRGFRFGIAGSKTRDVREGRNARREIARLLTELAKRK